MLENSGWVSTSGLSGILYLSWLQPPWKIRRWKGWSHLTLPFLPSTLTYRFLCAALLIMCHLENCNFISILSIDSLKGALKFPHAVDFQVFIDPKLLRHFTLQVVSYANMAPGTHPTTLKTKPFCPIIYPLFHLFFLLFPPTYWTHLSLSFSLCFWYFPH